MQPTVPPAPQRLLIFARLPEPGAVKTRLAATLGDGVAKARAALESGAAKQKLEALVALSQRLAGN